ncbi:MAG: hypothetical protein QG640_152 [Patescibacteria group bacterium]|nr:hypothetical protein [Patescibacteria group bacterium]
MTPEERSLLERTYKMAEENNEILRSIRRSNRWSMAVKAIYWIVIIGLSIGAFYFIQPYIEFMTSALGIGAANAGDPTASQSLLKNFQDLMQ